MLSEVSERIKSYASSASVCRSTMLVPSESWRMKQVLCVKLKCRYEHDAGPKCKLANEISPERNSQAL